MADRTLTVDIVTPERTVLSEEATSVVAPGSVGSFGVLPNHAPLLAELVPGELRLRRNGGEEIRLAVGGGFMQVFNNRITVLADSAEREDEIDVDRARASLERARQELREAQGMFSAAQVESAQAAIERAHNRLRIAGVR